MKTKLNIGFADYKRFSMFLLFGVAKAIGCEEGKEGEKEANEEKNSASNWLVCQNGFESGEAV